MHIECVVYEPMRDSLKDASSTTVPLLVGLRGGEGREGEEEEDRVKEGRGGGGQGGERKGKDDFKVGSTAFILSLFVFGKTTTAANHS